MKKPGFYPVSLRERWCQYTAPVYRDTKAVAATTAAFALLFLMSIVVLYTRPLSSQSASALLRILPLSPPTTTTPLLHPPPKEPTPTTPTDPKTATAASPLYTYSNTQDQPSPPAHPPSAGATTPLLATGDSLPPNRTSPAASPACDVTKGEWVYDPEGGPYYTNSTCYTIQEHQNCMKYGRPDTDFLKWRWKPDDCELPAFDPADFLEMMRDKSMAFVGDSLARNQMQSLMCLLSGVEYPEDVSETRDENFKRMRYASHNFTVSSFWSPFLVRAEEAHLPEHNWTGLWNLHLDEVDERWASMAGEFDYMVISGGNWFTRPAIFTVNNTVVGSNYYLRANISVLSIYYGHKKAVDTAFRAIASRGEFQGVTTVLRTVSPAHFENGEWNSGGDCPRTRPFGRTEAKLGFLESTMYRDQLKAFKKARRMGRNKGLDLRLVDATQAMLLRPDGHPSQYGHPPTAQVVMHNDCVHWCLPGPVDVWNDLLLHVLKI